VKDVTSLLVASFVERLEMSEEMDEPLTEELLDELLTSPNPNRFLIERSNGARDLSAYLTELLETHHLERRHVVKGANLNATYGYQIFEGQRAHPSRDIVLSLALAMGLTLRECDRLLQAAGVSRLYCKERRDAIIIFCLEHHASLNETNDVLFAYGEATIG
jgi:hypothetical protein